MMSQEFKLADSVLHRVVQIVQEAMLTGVDASDIMRQIRLVHDTDDQAVAVLSPTYQTMVKEHHDKLVEEAEKLQASKQQSVLIGSSDGHDRGDSGGTN